jgi:hypothetical protein
MLLLQALDWLHSTSTKELSLGLVAAQLRPHISTAKEYPIPLRNHLDKLERRMQETCDGKQLL